MCSTESVFVFRTDGIQDLGQSSRPDDNQKVRKTRSDYDSEISTDKLAASAGPAWFSHFPILRDLLFPSNDLIKILECTIGVCDCETEELVHISIFAAL
jgi:hypothetical protein